MVRRIAHLKSFADLRRAFVCYARPTVGRLPPSMPAESPACHGEIIAFLDGDDWWAPGKLGRVLEVMMADPSLGIVGHSDY